MSIQCKSTQRFLLPKWGGVNKLHSKISRHGPNYEAQNHKEQPT